MTFRKKCIIIKVELERFFYYTGGFLTVATAIEIQDLIEPRVLGRLGASVFDLQSSLPVNADGLPFQYVDAQLLLEAGMLDSELDADNLNNSLVPIDYSEGYPIVNGFPLWERLEGEPEPYFKLFKIYRDLPLTELRRTFMRTAELSLVEVRYINHIAKCFHWFVRAKSYDMCRAQELEEKKKRLITEIENSHSDIADSIVDKIMDFMDNEENVSLMSPKVALEWFQEGIRLKRISNGLDPLRPNIPYTQNPTLGQPVINIGIQNSQQLPQGAQQSEGREVVNLAMMKDVIDVLDRAGVLNKEHLVKATDIVDADIEEADVVADSLISAQEEKDGLGKAGCENINAAPSSIDSKA